MSDNINQQFLFLLPLPSSAPGISASLYGISYVITDCRFNIIGKKELLTCRGLDYQLPSPSYLFSLNIDPYTISKGLCECDFLDEVEKLVSNPNLLIFTWSVRNLQILESMSLRNIRENNILKKVNSLCDVNKVLKLNELFTHGMVFKSDNLVQCARKNGFNENIDLFDQTSRLDALIYLTRLMFTQNSALVNYLLKPQNEKISFLKKACESGKYLIDYNTKEHCIEVLKPAALFDEHLEALYYDGNEVLGKNYRFSDFAVLSPAGVMTEDRQALTGVNLNEAVGAIEQCNPMDADNDSSTLPLSISFFKNFTKMDMDIYMQYLSIKKNAITMPPISCSQQFRLLVLMLRGNNYKSTLLDNELKLYYKKCSAAIASQITSYGREIKALLGRINENDERQIALLQKIDSYPSSL